MSYIDLFTKLRTFAEKAGLPPGVADAEGQGQSSSVKQALDQKDSGRKSQVHPQFADQIQQILQLLGSIGMGGGGNGGGGNQSQPQSNTANTANTSNTTANTLGTSNTTLDLLVNTASVVNVITADIPTTQYFNVFPSNLSTPAIYTLQTGLADGMAVVAQKEGLQKLIDTFNACVTPTTIITLPLNYQEVVQGGIKQFCNNVTNYCFTAPNTYVMNNYPILIPPPLDTTDSANDQVNYYVSVPSDASPVVPPTVVDCVPDFYIPIFYPRHMDPYPGWIEWEGVVKFDKIYTKRTDANPPWSYSANAITYFTQETVAFNLDPYIEARNLTIEALVDLITNVLYEYLNLFHIIILGTGSDNLPIGANNNASGVSNTTPSTNPTSSITSNVYTSSPGSSSQGSSGGGSQSSSIVSQLMPLLNQMIQKADSDHLPNSVLNDGNIKQMLQQHGQDCSKGNQMARCAQRALQPQELENSQSKSN